MKKNLLKGVLLSVFAVAGVNNVMADEINATLIHTASSSCGTSNQTFTSDVDAATEHVNNSNFGGTWAGAAYAEFSFAIPEGQSITSATFTFRGIGESRRARDTKVNYVNADIALDYSALEGGSAKVDAAATEISTVSFPKGSSATFNVDVTDAVRTISNSQNYIIFKMTGNPGGGDVVGKGATGDDAQYIPTLTITTAEAASVTSYTVNFLDESGENALKEAVVYSGAEIGAEATASSDDMASFIANEKKYIYKEGNETITLVADAASNVINLKFREAATYTVTVKDMLANTLDEGTVFEGDDCNAYIPYYVFAAGKFYATPVAPEGSTLSYGQLTFSNVTANINAVVNYTEEENTNVVFFSEAENIEALTVVNDGYTQIRMSNGKAAYAAEAGTVITSLPKGKYTLTAATRAGTTVFSAGQNEILSLVASGSVVTTTSEEFELTEATDITVSAGSASAYFDYVVIRNTDGTVVAITTVSDKAAANAAIYNLAGQRVVKAQKGLYIMNGKKYMVK